MQADTRERLQRLLGYLDHDPGNAALLRDAAHAAGEANDLGLAKQLFARIKDAGELTDADSNMWAIAAMRSGEPQLAAETFAGLLEQNPGEQGLRFNLAWARALAGETEGALSVIDDDLVAVLPQAAALELQLLHAAGELDQAVERAGQHLERFPDYAPLNAAASVLALDIEDEALAQTCAERGGGHPDALTTLGTLALGGDNPAGAKPLFEQALAINDRLPRAWVGLGLTELLAGQPAEAAKHIENGAAIFGDHLGSWIAAGWASLVADDHATARKHFEHAVDLDGSFAEGQGSLAVIELLQGDREAALRRLEVAERLDRASFSCAFVRVLLSAGEGDAEKAQRIMEIALRQPVGEGSLSMAEMIARLAR